MTWQLGARRVVAPDGVQWRVGRTWMTRRSRRFQGRGRAGRANSLQAIGSGLPDLGGADLGQELLAVAAVVAVVLIVIPLLFFGLEPIVVGVLLAAGVLARTLLGQPWVIEARSIDPVSGGRRLEWRVRGWRQLQKLIGEVADQLAAGQEPCPVSSTR